MHGFDENLITFLRNAAILGYIWFASAIWAYFEASQCSHWRASIFLKLVSPQKVDHLLGFLVRFYSGTSLSHSPSSSLKLLDFSPCTRTWSLTLNVTARPGESYLHLQYCWVGCPENIVTCLISRCSLMRLEKDKAINWYHLLITAGRFKGRGVKCEHDRVFVWVSVYVWVSWREGSEAASWLAGGDNFMQIHACRFYFISQGELLLSGGRC